MNTAAQASELNDWYRGYMAHGKVDEEDIKHEPIEYKLGYARAKRDEGEE